MASWQRLGKEIIVFLTTEPVDVEKMPRERFQAAGGVKKHDA